MYSGFDGGAVSSVAACFYLPQEKGMQISFYLTLATLLLIVYYPCINKVAHHDNNNRNHNS